MKHSLTTDTRIVCKMRLLLRDFLCVCVKHQEESINPMCRRTEQGVGVLIFYSTMFEL